MEEDFKLIAPHVNRLLSCYEGFQNPEQPGAELMKALDPLFKAMADLAPYEKNDEAKGIWIIVPREILLTGEILRARRKTEK